MSDETQTLTRLGAYVDGQLSAREAAQVAAALAKDPSLAQKVAVLSRLKATVQESFEGGTPAMTVADRRGGGRPALAACLGFLAFLMATAIAHWASLPGTPERLSLAWAKHRAWQAEAGLRTEGAGDKLLQVVGLDPGLTIPDLTSARLRLTHLRRLSSSEGGPGLHLGYEGSRGCQVSLFIYESLFAQRERLAEFSAGLDLAFGWRAGGRGHLILAHGMDPHRFRLIAAKVAQATREAAPFDKETRQALARSRATAPPCLS